MAFLVIAVWVICQQGCGSREFLNGYIVGTDRGSGLGRFGLRQHTWKELADWDLDSGGSAGVGGMQGSIALMSTRGYLSEIGSVIVLVDTSTGRVDTVGTGCYPTVLEKHAGVLWYQLDGVASNRGRLIWRETARSPRADTLGEVVAPSSKWFEVMSAAVEMDSGLVASVGADGAIWRVDLRSRTWQRLGHAGLVPRFWQPSERLLVCSDDQSGAKVVGISADGGRSVEVPGLRGMRAYAPSRTAPISLAIVPTKWALPYDDTRLIAYDWKTGRVGTLTSNVHFWGRMSWSE